MFSRSTILEAVLIVVIGTLVPWLLLFGLSWQMSVGIHQKQIDSIADHAIAHTLNVLSEAVTTLSAVRLEERPPCSQEHVDQMRRLSFNSLTIDNLSYVADGFVQCSALGLSDYRILEAPIEYRRPDGIGLTVNYDRAVLRTRPVMLLAYGPHRALLDQRRLFTPLTIADTSMEIVSPTGKSLAYQAQTSGTLPVSAVTDDFLVARREAQGWAVIVRGEKQGPIAYLQTVKSTFIALATVLALLCSGFVWLLFRRRCSDRGELEIAVHQRRLVTHYQPIINLTNGACFGAEALVRWRRPDGTFVKPDLFIPLAEESGLIAPITDQIIEMIVEDLGPLLRKDREFHIAINLSAADISSGRILSVLERVLSGSDIEPRQIWLEATERSFVDIEGARATLTELRRRGYISAIDDFGTGYSGLKYLQHLPVDVLKIDKSFIDAIGTDAPTRHVTEHIIALARELDLRVIAEGVECEEQADYLRAQQVAYAQGWLFSRALPAAELTAFCQMNRARHGMPTPFTTSREPADDAMPSHNAAPG